MSGEAVGLLDEPLMPRLVGFVAEPLLLRYQWDFIDPRRQFRQNLEDALRRGCDNQVCRTDSLSHHGVAYGLDEAKVLLGSRGVNVMLNIILILQLSGSSFIYR